MANPVLTAVSCCLAVSTLVAVVLLIRQRQITTRLRARGDTLEDAVQARDEEVEYLASVRLRTLADFPRTATSMPGPLHERLSTTEFARNLRHVADLYSESLRTAITSVDQSAKSALKAMMRTVQSLANEQQLSISGMEERHDDPHVLEDLLKIDHANSQLGRRVQATAVLCGAWPGQQRSASTLTDVVRGATSRIRDYQRVQVHTQTENAVTSRAVEPVVLTLAEVLDNAARHSQPNTFVEVNFQPSHNGIAIVVDDAGVGLNTDELEEASKLLTGERAVEMNALGDPPRVGFAVVGVLAARYGFTVSVDTRSPYGGVRAVVFLPTALLTRVEGDHQVPRREPLAVPSSGDIEPPEKRGVTANGLPKRRRHTRAEPSLPPEETSASAAAPSRPARKVAKGMDAWQRGTRSGRTTSQPDGEGNSQP